MKYVLGIGVLSLFIACQPTPPTPEAIAQAAYDRGAYDTAVVAYLQALETDSTRTDWQWQIARCYEAQGNNVAAIEAYEHLLQMDPESDAVVTLGRLYQKNQQYEAAIQTLEPLNNAQADEDVKVALGASYAAVGKAEKALELSRAVLEKDAQHVEALHNLAMVAESQGLLQVAIDYHEQLLAIDSTYWASYPVVSNLYSSTGQSKKAIAYGKKALEVFPNNVDMLNNMGFIYMEIKDYPSALEYFARVIEQDPKHAYAYNNKGYLLLQAEEYALAQEAIEESLSLDADNAYAYRNLAIAYAHQGEREASCKAIRAAQQAKFRVRLKAELETLEADYCR